MRPRLGTLITTAALLSAAAIAPSAQAAFPGVPGAIVFTSGIDGDFDLYAINPDGTGLRNITNTPGREQQGAVSATGSSIAYKTVTASPRDEETWVIGFDGTGARQLTDTPGALRFSTQPAWSPDGTRLLVRSNRDAGNYDVWSIRASDGGDPIQLTRDAADDRYPVPSPDGRRIAFRSDRAGTPDVWVMNADGSAPVDLTAPTGLWESAPAWSPDGTRLSFERTSKPGDPDTDASVAASDEIWTMAADGTDQRRLTDNATKDEGAAWSPDGTQIAFTTEREEPKGDIWIMQADGSAPHKLFGSAAVEESPDWQPLIPPAGAGPGPVQPMPITPGPPSPPRDTTRPAISGLRVTPARFTIGSLLPALARAARTGTTIRFRLSEPATVRLTFAVARGGRRSRSRCRTPTRARRRAAPCTRYVTIAPSVRLRGARAGTNEVRFQGRLTSARILAPGRYRVTAIATGAAGNRSAAKSAALTLVRRGR